MKQGVPKRIPPGSIQAERPDGRCPARMRKRPQPYGAPSIGWCRPLELGYQGCLFYPRKGRTPNRTVRAAAIVVAEHDRVIKGDDHRAPAKRRACSGWTNVDQVGETPERLLADAGRRGGLRTRERSRPCQDGRSATNRGLRGRREGCSFGPRGSGHRREQPSNAFNAVRPPFRAAPPSGRCAPKGVSFDQPLSRNRSRPNQPATRTASGA